ncbi:DMT family transporter [Tritonibacter mobilis]|uniref:Multidrug DMT transporter permease n=1 Tax=Tritonibacter mobilis F1926 TaxID=1265309 RepID=A0A1B1A1T6_9RHOB|nr:DMT family transporter [Tritonibacter mobilis]ANP40447.1 multidrug DMT transporter permease [Tritonibacter mobilis F1926]KJZ25198.1 multidrug DMT transporter permease [Tritonibacter mobilis]MBU3035296.1 DMT family transporter [Tritonibacter mobilis]WHQ83758.1 DMT family transporter [Tritonibacter mobilis]
MPGSATTPASEQDNTLLRAAIWMIGAILSFSAMAIAGREASLSLDTFEIMMYRSFVGIIVVAAAITVLRRWHMVSTKRLAQHGLRNMAHFTGQNLWFYAVSVIPLAQVFALEFTSPIWVILLAPLLLGEKLTRMRGIAVTLGFIGILIVARPSPATFNIGLACAAGSAIFFALTNIATKRLTRNESIWSIMFWLTTMQLIMGIIFAGWDFDITLPDAQSLPFILIIGCAGLSAHFCITNALSLAPAALVVPIDFARLPFIALLGWLIYGESVEIWLFVGAALILAGNFINIVSSRQQ